MCQCVRLGAVQTVIEKYHVGDGCCCWVTVTFSGRGVSVRVICTPIRKIKMWARAATVGFTCDSYYARGVWLTLFVLSHPGENKYRYARL